MFRKLSLLIILLTSIGFISCSDSIINNPESPSTENTTLSKPGNGQGLVKHPTTITKSINGETGGVIHLTGLYVGSDLRVNVVNAKLDFPPGSFEGTRNITLTADYQMPSIICEPHMDFNKELSLDLIYTGLDLEELGFTPENVGFAYIAEDGTTDPCQYDSIDFVFLRGILGVHNAKIKHFSRFGYTR